MDFFAAQEQARKKTRWLMFWFALAVMCIVVLTHLVAMQMLYLMIHDSLFALVPIAMFLVYLGVALGSIYVIYLGARARNNSFLIMALGLVQLLMMLWFLSGLLGFLPEAFDTSESLVPGSELVKAFLLWDNPLIFCFSLLVGVAIVLASRYKIRQIAGQGGTLIAEQLGGRMILRDTSDPAERRLLNVIDEMAVAAGIPTPVAYVLPQEHGLNAFAAGLSTQDSVIAVTQGLLNAMNRDELQGIIAHEISHIAHGDSRLNTKLIGILFGLYVLTLLGRKMWWMMRKLLKAMVIPKMITVMVIGFKMITVMVIGFILYIIGSVGLFFGRLIQAAVSREREYLADAAAVQFARNSAGLVSALNKLRVSGSQIRHPQALAASHLFFGASEKSSWFATHPPLEERIRRIGGEALPLPESVVQAQILLARLPENLRQAVSSESGAKGIVCGLFLSTTQPELRLWQEKFIPLAARPVAQALDRWLSSQPEQGAQYRLTLLDLALPTLRGMSNGASKSVYGDFLFLVEGLFNDKDHVNPGKFAIYSILENTLLPPLKRRAKSGKLRSKKQLDSDIAYLLALIAYSGHEDVEIAKAAYQAALEHSPAQEKIPFPNKGTLSCDVIFSAFGNLALTAPLSRKKILEACAIAIQHDGKITPVENELLRAFAQSLDCPAPLA